jgi:hypothetical protein
VMALERRQRRRRAAWRAGRAELPEELLKNVLEALQAAEQCTPQDGGWGGCKAGPGDDVQWMRVPP